jgi:predicted MPP superfamily phosphohydrolase
MWFAYLAAGLVVLTIGGILAQRRVARALSHLGVTTRVLRVVRWATAWLLFGYPILVIASIAISRLLGGATPARLDGPIASRLLAVPFAWALLIVVQSVPWLIAIDVVQAITARRRGTADAARPFAIAVLAVVGAFALYTPLRILAERGELRVRHHRLGAEVPSAPAPFRIAFVSDVHQDAHTDAEHVRDVYSRINAERPDIVLSGGDWISTGPDYIASAAASAAALSSRLGTFSVRGDHEHFAYADRERSVSEIERAMQHHGIAVLDNEIRWFDHHGKRIAVVFLNHNYIHRTDRSTIAALLARVAGADYAIVVTHQLDASLASQLENKVNLVLAGHTHAGQVNPVVGLVHVNLARLETPFVDGRYELGHTAIIVTAGVGFSILPFRYAAPASIELIDLPL